jgi:RNA polymerase sigma factor (sigma-70 family)
MATMSSSQCSAVVKQVVRLYGEGTVGGMTEAQLVERFAARRDETAFEALVAHHGPMVLAVCRGVLRDPNDADDAFQATFLVLARKAGTIRGQQAVGAWLYRVARRVALRSGMETTRRRSKEQIKLVEPATESDDSARAEMRRIVHEEVDRLPSRDRAAVVLCDLEGRTHEEAARQLNWPVGTVKGRLFRARGKLRDRLSRRGLAGAAVISSGVASGSRAALVSDVLRESTIRAAIAFASHQSAKPWAPAAALAQGVLSMMLRDRVKLAGGWMLAASFVTLGSGAVILARPQTLQGGPQSQATAQARNDQEAFQGKWTLASSHEDGLRPSEEVRGEMTIRGNRVTSGSTGSALVYEMTLQTAGDHRGIDLRLLSVQSKDGRDRAASQKTVLQEVLDSDRLDGRVVRGIYELKDGLLKIAYARPNEPRPTAFGPGEGGSYHLLVWRKAIESPPLPGSAPGHAKEGEVAFAATADGDSAVALAAHPESANRQPQTQTGRAVVGNDEFFDRQTNSELLEIDLGILKGKIIEETTALLNMPEVAQHFRNIQDGEKLREAWLQDRARREDRLQILKRDYLQKSRELKRLEYQLQEATREAARAEVGADSRQPAERSASPDRAISRRSGGSSRESGGSTGSRTWTAKVGDTLIVEVLEALPGRPITGDRRVREDGTISLGFYGDVMVEGLTRRQIKEKIIAHLQKHLTDEVLGLSFVDERGLRKAVPPAESDTVFVDDVPSDSNGRADVNRRARPEPAGDSGRLLRLEQKVDGLIEAFDRLQRQQPK